MSEINKRITVEINEAVALILGSFALLITIVICISVYDFKQLEIYGDALKRGTPVSEAQCIFTTRETAAACLALVGAQK